MAESVRIGCEYLSVKPWVLSYTRKRKANCHRPHHGRESLFWSRPSDCYAPDEWSRRVVSPVWDGRIGKAACVWWQFASYPFLAWRPPAAFGLSGSTAIRRGRNTRYPTCVSTAAVRAFADCFRIRLLPAHSWLAPLARTSIYRLCHKYEAARSCFGIERSMSQ